jgi:AcrR family transcriptional regulator
LEGRLAGRPSVFRLAGQLRSQQVEASLDTAREAAPRTDREAAPRQLEGEKAQRIVAAMRTSVGTRGAAGSTFDHVAKEAGVSRGLLHYYFGSKERLLVEVVRHDCDLRIRGMEERIAGAGSVDEIVVGLVQGLEEFVGGEPGSQAVVYEMLSASRHSEEIRAELAELYRRWRAHLADALRSKEREGIVALQADAETVAAVLFALGDGMGLQMISDPTWRGRDAALELGIGAAHRLLGAGE